MSTCILRRRRFVRPAPPPPPTPAQQAQALRAEISRLETQIEAEDAERRSLLGRSLRVSQTAHRLVRQEETVLTQLAAEQVAVTLRIETANMRANQEIVPLVRLTTILETRTNRKGTDPHAVTPSEALAQAREKIAGLNESLAAQVAAIRRAAKTLTSTFECRARSLEKASAEAVHEARRLRSRANEIRGRLNRMTAHLQAKQQALVELQPDNGQATEALAS